MLPNLQLTAGDHSFESLGFEDCCDGHAELEVHLTCDSAAGVQAPWRVVVSGETECLKCDAVTATSLVTGAGNGAETKGRDVAIGGDTGTSGLSVWHPRGDWAPQPAYNSHGLFADNTITSADIDMSFDAFRATIDQNGLFDDWDCLPYMGQPPFHVNAAHDAYSGGETVQFEEYAGGTWFGVADNAAAISFAWDPDNLYLGIKVKDDSHQLNGNSGWDGDSVQVVFANNERDQITHLYNYALSEAGDHVAHHQQGPGGTTVTIERDETTKMTGYEVTFPASSVDRTTFLAEDIIAVGITVNDGDAEPEQGGQKGWSGWGPHSAVYGKTPGECGLVTLRPNTAVAGCTPGTEFDATQLDVTGHPTDPPPPPAVMKVCQVSTASAAQCGTAGGHATCTGSQSIRLSAHPQGRIEVFNQNVGSWGTVCGHWYWDNDGVANIACRALGYDGGSLYTYGASSTLEQLPIVAGMRICSAEGSEATIFDCAQGGDANCRLPTGGDTKCDMDCQRTGAACETISTACTHSIDQGAICYRQGASEGQLKCHTHNAVGDDACDDWHHCTEGCQACGGCHFGCSQVDDSHSQDVLFGCVDFASTECQYCEDEALETCSGTQECAKSAPNVNPDGTCQGKQDVSYSHALRAFAQCMSVSPQTDGYCRGSLASAAFLHNRGVCAASDGSSASNHNIGFQ